MNSFWSTFYKPPKRGIAITTSLQGALQSASKAPCPTVRRLAMARQMAANATDPTARRLANRVIGDWWQGFTVDRLRPQGQVQP